MLVKDERTPEQWLGERLRQLRMACGMSQNQVAEAMAQRGFSWGQTTTTKTESGDRPIRWNEVVALAGIFGVSAQAVIGVEAGEDPGLIDAVRADAAVKEAHARLRRAREETSDAEAAWEAALEQRRSLRDRP